MIEIDLDADPTVRAIPRLPDARICRVEGRNGIGKSLAIRLLELGTGGRPYHSEPKAWSHLKNLVRTVSVRIDLPDGQLLTWNSSPSDWPVKPEDPAPEWIGRYELGGIGISHERAWSLVQVRRLAGDQTISDVIADRIAEDSVDLTRLRPEYDEKHAALVGECHEVLAVLRRLDVTPLIALRESEASCNAAVEALSREVLSLDERRDRLASALGLRSAAAKIESDLPTISARIKEITARTNEIVDLRSEIDARLSGLAQRAELEAAQEERREKAKKALTEAEEELAVKIERAEALGARTDMESGHADELARLRELGLDLVEEKTRYDRMPRLQRLILKLDGFLVSEVDGDLVDETLAEIRDAKVSVSLLRERLSAQRRALANLPPSERVIELERELSMVGQTVVVIQQYLDAVKDVENAETKVKRRRTTLREAEEPLMAAAEKEMVPLQERLKALQEERDALGSERARLLGHQTVLLSSGDADELERQVSDATAELGDPDLWPSLLAAVESEKEEKTVARKTTQERLIGLGSDVEQARSGHLAELALAARARPWLLTRIGVTASEGLDGLIDAAPRVLDERSRVETVVADLDKVNRAVLGLTGTLGEMSSNVRRQAGAYEDASEPPDYSSARRYYEDSFRDYFSSERISSALFGGGEFERLDLEAFAIRWRNTEGVVQARPLEAFSSGERAFAYTLASLESLTMGTAALRIVALDEFGAFIAQDRMAQLVGFLRDHVLGRVADRIVIVLPMSAEAAAIGLQGESEDPRERAFARSFHERGYVAFDESDTPLEIG